LDTHTHREEVSQEVDTEESELCDGGDPGSGGVTGKLGS